MPRIIYIHGFLSSSKSKKAEQTRAWLSAHRPDIHYFCPDLSSYPAKAKFALTEFLSQASATDNFLIGSSLGGFWASHFVEAGLAEKAVLVNPAVSPQLRFADLVGQELNHYYSDETIELTENDLGVLADSEPRHVERTDRQWLLAQTGDEVLDYRLAERRYCDCKVTIEEGGDHSFENFERWLPEIIAFFGI